MVGGRDSLRPDHTHTHLTQHNKNKKHTLRSKKLKSLRVAQSTFHARPSILKPSYVVGAGCGGRVGRRRGVEFEVFLISTPNHTHTFDTQKNTLLSQPHDPSTPHPANTHPLNTSPTPNTHTPPTHTLNTRHNNAGRTILRHACLASEERSNSTIAQRYLRSTMQSRTVCFFVVGFFVVGFCGCVFGVSVFS